MSLWRALLEPFASPAAEAARWVVVDCETSGLDPARDRLLALGAVGVRGARIGADDFFEATLAQERPSTRENILVHRIGGGRQRAGQPPAAALAAFAGFVGGAPCVAFRAAFDQAFVARAARAAGVRPPRRWLDLARLLPLLFAARAGERATLDEWLAAFGVRHPSRHDALADAFVTAQLFLIALAEAKKQGFASVRSVAAAARAMRWSGR